MGTRPRPRLTDDCYIGCGRYALTLCAADRRAVFVTPDAVTLVLSQILRAARQHRFTVLAYCFMPDHLHLLVGGTASDARLRRCVHAVKQYSGFAYRRRTGGRLWQASYHDHVLRRGESTRRAVRYIVENPVRAGLVRSAEAYPFSGSELFSLADLVDAAGHASESGRP